MHIHTPKPLHGWREFIGEVGIIVLGILIALGFEQVVETVHWRNKVRQATAALHVAVAANGLHAVEQQVAGPCIDRQLVLLEGRLMATGPYRPATLYRDSSIPFTVRTPSRTWTDSVWRIVTGEGVSTHLSSAMREQMDGIYQNLEEEDHLAQQNDQMGWRLNSLALPVFADAVGRARTVQDIEELRGRQALMTLVAGQLLGDIQEAGMMPSARAIRDFVYRGSGTIAFCRSHRLPLAAPRPIHV